MSEEFGLRLKEIRTEQNISTEQLSSRVGVSSNILLKIEEGNNQVRLSFPVIESIAEALNVETDMLIKVD